MAELFESLMRQVAGARRSIDAAEAERLAGVLNFGVGSDSQAEQMQSNTLSEALGIPSPPTAIAGEPMHVDVQTEQPEGGLDGLLKDLRRRASVLTWFAVEDLVPAVVEEPLRARAITVFLEDCERNPTTSKFILNTEVRQRELEQLATSGQLPAALTAAGPGDDRLCQFFHRLLRGRTVSAKRINDADLRLLEQAAEWTHGIIKAAPDPRDIRTRRSEKAFLKELEPLLADGFFGRREERKQLAEFFEARVEDGPHNGIIVVTGLGGSGKSTLIARFLRDIRKRVPQPLIAWLDFDRSSLDPVAPHLMSFEVARQIGLQVPETAAALHERREQIRREETESDAFRQGPSGQSFGEHGSKGAYEMNFAIASQLATARQATGPLIVILDTFEEVTRRGARMAEAVVRWAGELAGRLAAGSKRKAIKVLISGRLYDEQLQWAMEHSPYLGTPRKLDLAPLGANDASQLLRRHGVARPVADRIVRSGVPLQPLPLLLIAQLEHDDPGFDLAAFVLETAALPERQRAEMFSSLVYWRYLARLRDPAVQVLAHPGLVLRRVSPNDIREVLVPALNAAAYTAGEAIAKLFRAIAVPAAGPAVAQTGELSPQLMARELATLGEAEFASAIEKGDAKAWLAEIEQLTGATGLNAISRYEIIETYAGVLTALDEEALEDVYQKLVSYAWLVEKRSDGAWHRPEIRRLMLRHMIAQMPAVARSIHEKAIEHYQAEDPSEAMYHSLMLAGTPEACGQLARGAVQSAVTGIGRDAADFPAAAHAYFSFVASGEIDDNAVHLLPPAERASAFDSAGQRLVRAGKFEEAWQLMSVRPPAATLGIWEVMTRYVLVKWDELASGDFPGTSTSGPAKDRHFLTHNRAFAQFLTGDLVAAAAGFDEAIRLARQELKGDDNLFLLARSIIYRLIVDHAGDRSPSRIAFGTLPLISNAMGELLLKKSFSSVYSGLEWPRLIVLSRQYGEPGEMKLIRFEIDLLPFNPDLLDALNDAMLVLDGRNDGTGIVAATQRELAQIGADARTTREMLRRINELRRRKDLLIGKELNVSKALHDDPDLLQLLRGPDPEFRDPLRTALMRAFRTAEDHEALAMIISEASPFRLTDLEPKAFAKNMIADPETTMVSLVEFMDRARIMEIVLRRARDLKPHAIEIAKVDDGYRRWCQAFSEAAITSY